MSERQLRWLELGVLILGFILGGMLAFNNLSTRIALAEQKIDQETKGYFVLQTSISERLGRLEEKIDKLSEHVYRQGGRQ